MYFRDEESNQQQQPQFQEHADFQCPWADNCPYLQAYNDTELRQYQPYNRPRPQYPMPYHPYYPPYYNQYHHPYYHPYYHNPYGYPYQNHENYDQGHGHSYGPGRDEE